jgi:protein translocase SecG subunit
MATYFLISQIFFSAALVALIMIQPKGSGLGRSWKGSVSFARRGLELLVFRSTFVVAGLLILSSILPLVI